MLVLAIITIGFTVVQVASQSNPSCNSQIFCQGLLLHTVQMAKVFNDSKTFVDMKLKYNETTTLENFDLFMTETNQAPTRDEIKQFVENNFESFDGLEEWTPTDYNENPRFLSKINDPEIKKFAQDLVKIWPVLARKVKQDVFDNSELFTLLPVTNGFIVPGGRFREFYYWDSYWIVRGLLISDMDTTVKGMLDNFISLIKQYGFIPNGARKYYLNRSQPPLLSFMAYEYIKKTQDITWLKDNLQWLDKELTYWLETQTINITKNGVIYELALYDVESGSPRPESYAEDVNTANFFTEEAKRIQLYADLKSGAESGWDFSSRWFVDPNGGSKGNLTNLKTREIIPVDLNAFLCRAFRIISEFYFQFLEVEKAVIWRKRSLKWATAIHDVFYDEEDGIWYDWNHKLEQSRKLFYPSNLTPLWALNYDVTDAEELGQKAVNYLKNNGILDYPGGTPTSTSRTGEQWDDPNAWPPLQDIVVQGLYKTGQCDAKTVAKDLAAKWVSANLIGYTKNNEMFEKYDAENPGEYGGGGEYTVQSGFGWTNGVALEFIQIFFSDDN